MYCIFKAQFDEEERLQFIAQRVSRVAAIFLDETNKDELCQALLCQKVQELVYREDPRAQAIRRRYGYLDFVW